MQFYFMNKYIQILKIIITTSRITYGLYKILNKQTNKEKGESET